jgi:hypothetical protein
VEQAESNSRLTSLLGASLLVALAVEGLTVLDVRGMLTLHVFFGLFVVPAVCVKLGSTGYRMLSYYRGREAFVKKGPPHPILRVLGPVVALSTVSMLLFGIVTLATGPQHREPWLTLHQGSFAVWFAAMTVHVIGHALETWRHTRDDVRNRPPLPKRGTRIAVVATSLVVGLGLGLASLGWHGQWDNFHFRSH